MRITEVTINGPEKNCNPKFEDLDCGQWFIYENIVYIKVSSENGRTPKEWNMKPIPKDRKVLPIRTVTINYEI